MKRNLLVYCHSRCSTCRKALRWLDESGIAYQAFDIVTQTPSRQELLELMKKGSYPLRRWFNTSGQKYREMNLKERLEDITVEEAARLLSENGMLIRRPLMTDGTRVALGFNEQELRDWLKD